MKIITQIGVQAPTAASSSAMTSIAIPIELIITGVGTVIFAILIGLAQRVIKGADDRFSKLETSDEVKEKFMHEIKERLTRAESEFVRHADLKEAFGRMEAKMDIQQGRIETKLDAVHRRIDEVLHPK